jgi:hypothetical protein
MFFFGDRLSTEWQKNDDLLLDLFVWHEFRNEQDIADGRANRLLGGRYNESRD